MQFVYVQIIRFHAIAQTDISEIHWYNVYIDVSELIILQSY